MKKSNKGFSIVIGMGVVIVATLAAYFILSFSVPFAKNIKGIESSTSSYYNAYGGVEDGVYFINKERSNITTDKSYYGTSATSYDYVTFSSGYVIPLKGLGDSDFDNDYNFLSGINPIQLQVGGLGNIWNSGVKFYFKVPNLNSNTLYLSGGVYNVINWSLISPTETLVSTGDYIKSNDIYNSKNISSYINIGTKVGETIYGTGMTFSNFYSSYCSGECILKMSLISDLHLNDIKKTEIPNISYKIDFGTVRAPLRFTTIKSIGKTFGFRKDLEIKIPQQTVPQAFDFTVFQ